MSVIAWIVLGLAAGFSNASTWLNAATWLTAIAGAAVLLLVYHLVTGQSGRSRRTGWFAHR